MRITAILILFFSVGSLFAYNIEGRLLNERYFPVPNVLISISAGGSVKTDDKGTFSLTTSKMPYDILVYDKENSRGVLYTDLSNPNPELIFFGVSQSAESNNEFIKVFFNPIPSGSSAIVKFVSEDISYCPEITVLSGEKSKPLSIEWPSISDNINGKVIYLEKNQTSYTKYAEKVITVSKDFYQQTISFDSSTFYSKPQTDFITIYMPDASLDRKGFSVYADFLTLNRNAELTLNSTEGDIRNVKVIVPQTLPLGYRLKVSSFGYLKSGAQYQNFTYSYPGSTCKLQDEEPPGLTGPQNQYYFVNKNTMFSYERGSGTGFYVVHFHSYNPVSDFYIVTNNREVKSPVGSYPDFFKGLEYSWQVMKYTSYISVDDFSKARVFSNDLGSKSILTSELRTFRLFP